MDLGEEGPNQNRSLLELPSFSQDYELLLQDRENADNSLNKLRVKRQLIAEAVGKNGPKKDRGFVRQTLEVSKLQSISELPGNMSMKMTQMIAKRLLGASRETAVTAQ